MFGKLAFRNVKRQVGNYLIYFITVSITVALMFAVNNVIFNKQLMAFAESMQELKSGLIGITVFVSIIVAFVLGYATSFMLKLRKREFGTYLTLGMTRKNILSIFILETMILCVAAILAGILLGVFIYQGLMALITNLMEMEFSFASYSVSGLLLTIALVVTVFLLSSVTSSLYLNRVSVYHLLHGDRMVEKKVKHPMFWMAVAVLSGIAIVGCCVVFYQTVLNMFQNTNSDQAGFLIFSCFVTLGVALIIFHIGASKSIVNLLLKNEKFRNHRTNTFILRQLSGKLSANAVMAGFLSFLIAFAIIGSNVSFMQKTSEKLTLDKNYPFDITANLDPKDPSPISMEQAEQTIQNYSEIQRKIPYRYYASQDNTLYRQTKWSGEGYEGLNDTFITESDFNLLCEALGIPTVTLNGTYKIIADIPQVQAYDFSSTQLDLNGKTYCYGGILTDVPMFSYYYFTAIVPDEAVQGLDVELDCMAYDLKQDRYDAEALRQDLSYQTTSRNGQYLIERCDYDLKEYGRIQRNSNTAIFIIGALYISIVFVFLAMAILALKTLSSLSDDRQKYRILFRLGTGEQEQNRTLFYQIFSFFLLPFAVPVLLSVPTAQICAKIMEMSGYAGNVSEVVTTTTAIAFVVVAIYALYFVATYLIAKRNIVHRQQ